MARSKAAHSNITLTGAVGDFAFLAAHDAGQARGRLPRRQMTSIGRWSGRAPCRPACVSVSPSWARAHDDLVWPRTLARSKACMGWPVSSITIVGDVHDVVDGAHAGAVAATRAATWARAPIAHVFDHAGDSSAGSGLVILHASPAHDRAISPCRRPLTVHLGQRQWCAERGGGLARDAPDAQAVGAVGENLKIDHVRRPGRRSSVTSVPRGILLVENQDAVVDARRGTAPAGTPSSGPEQSMPQTFHAAQLALLDLRAAGQLARRPGLRAPDCPSRTLGAPQTICSGSALAHVHRAHVQMVAVFG